MKGYNCLLQVHDPFSQGRMLMARDTIFKTKAPAEKFAFNDRVADVFDDMLDRSVPFYRQVIEMTAEIMGRHLQPRDRVYDLGCSTGTTLLFLARELAQKKLAFVGVDNSKAMLDKALRKVEMFSMPGSIDFIEDDITQVVFAEAGGVILNYTLQFITPAVRGEFLRKVCNGLRAGGVLVLSEKVVCPDRDRNEQFLHSYNCYKKRRGYSELEIANKREALENVLIPLSIEENATLLRQAGFSRVDTFFQWFNFVSYVACK
jgi:tRNA (cmo5U34)-methyltransferase